MTSKMLIKHSFRGLVDPAKQEHALYPHKEMAQNALQRFDFLLGPERTLLSDYKNAVKGSDNALTKPVTQALHFGLKYIDRQSTEARALRGSVLQIQFTAV